MPGRWRTVLSRVLEVVLALVLYRVYAALRNLQGRAGTQTADTATAERHGADVLALEQRLHLDVEHAVQDAVLALPEVAVRVADAYYAGAHLPVTALVFVWLAARQPRVHAAWRNVLVVGTALSLAGFALFPTAPPRLMPGSGYVDTVHVHGGLWSAQAPVLEHIAHPYAALPSLHVLWAVWAGLAVARWAHARWVRRLGAAHIALTCLFVVVTGNHWVLDIAAAAAVFAVAVLVCAALAALPARLTRRGPAATPPPAPRSSPAVSEPARTPA